jgi:hypothetical protein
MLGIIAHTEIFFLCCAVKLKIIEAEYELDTARLFTLIRPPSTQN